MEQLLLCQPEKRKKLGEKKRKNLEKTWKKLGKILSLPADSLDIAPPSPPLASSVMVVRSILFSYDGPLTRR